MQSIQAPERTTGDVRRPMSYEEYLALDTDAVIAEWVDGEVIIHMPPTDEHQRLVGFLYQLVAMFVQLKTAGFARIAPLEVRLTEVGPSREPDILFLASEHADRLTSKRVEGAPDLVIEIISPESVQRDRSEKFREYEAAGVREYWIVDSRDGARRADFFVLDETGRYSLAATEADEQFASMVLPGFRLRPAWLWQEPPITPLKALAEIVGVEALLAHLQNPAADNQ